MHNGARQDAIRGKPAIIKMADILTDTVAARLEADFAGLFEEADHCYLEVAREAVATALGIIAQSNALYHNVEHTAQVTLVGLAILSGRQLNAQDVTPGAWLETVVALACHDIGYVRGACRADRADAWSTGVADKLVRAMPGATDAVLTPYHVDRGKRFVAERFAKFDILEVGRVQACIERTRFPIPPHPAYQSGSDYPGLVRGADLIGQLADPRYLQKLPAVFFEFEEIGFNDKTGYRCPGDLLETYPEFFTTRVLPFIADSIRYLNVTPEGREVVTQLHQNLASAEAYCGEAGGLPSASSRVSH